MIIGGFKKFENRPIAPGSNLATSYSCWQKVRAAELIIPQGAYPLNGAQGAKEGTSRLIRLQKGVAFNKIIVAGYARSIWQPDWLI